MVYKKEIRKTTAPVNYPHSKCVDCQKEGVCAIHWGPLVPYGQQGSFCPDCWHRRLDDDVAGKEPRPATLLREYSLRYREEQIKIKIELLVPD